jgi:hypothetical protein
MRRLFVLLGAASATGAVFFGGQSGQWMIWLAVPATLGLVALAWRYRCLHRGPLSLLPAVTDFTGHRLPARWFCDRCGQAWPALFDHETKPVQKFVGYDEKKASMAIERAQVLEDQKRTIAMQRAGLSRTRIVRRRARGPGGPVEPPVARPNVVPIADIRRQA